MASTDTSPTSPVDHTMPAAVRTSSTMTSDDMGDPSDPLYARFKTWRHVIGNLIEYFEYRESMLKTQSKEYTKLSKTLEVPFKTPEFAQDGIAAIWQGMRDKGMQMSTFYEEEAKALKAGVIADLTRLRGDIKKHLSDLDKEGREGSKKVGKRLDKFSDTTQALGKWIPVAETNPTSLDVDHDPYVLSRQIRHKLYRVVDEENQLNEQLLALQKRCEHYEKVILQAIQKALKDQAEHVARQSQYETTTANEMTSIAFNIPPEREWTSFANREPTLLPADYKPRDPANVDFPFSNHPSTKPVIEGLLARKSTVLKRSSSAYYVLSPSGYLLEYKDHDPILNPDPTLAIKLTDSDLGNSPARSGKAGFTIKGKDAGKSIGMSHEYVFKTDSMDLATKWWNSIEKFVGNAPRENTLTSPVKTTASESDDELASPVSARDQAVPAQAATTHTASKTATVPQTAQPGPTTAAPTTTARVAEPTTAAHQAAPTTTATGHAGPTATDPALAAARSAATSGTQPTQTGTL